VTRSPFVCLVCLSAANVVESRSASCAVPQEHSASTLYWTPPTSRPVEAARGQIYSTVALSSWERIWPWRACTADHWKGDFGRAAFVRGKTEIKDTGRYVRTGRHSVMMVFGLSGHGDKR
jgi:hypothetical protein